MGDWGSVSLETSGRLHRLEHSREGEELEGIYPPKTLSIVDWRVLSEAPIPSTSVQLSAPGRALGWITGGICSKPWAPMWTVRTKWAATMLAILPFPWKNIRNSHTCSHPCLYLTKYSTEKGGLGLKYKWIAFCDQNGWVKSLEIQ